MTVRRWMRYEALGASGFGLLEGEHNISKANVVMLATSGFDTNTSKLPLEPNKDCLKAFSAISPSTNASTKGAKG